MATITAAPTMAAKSTVWCTVAAGRLDVLTSGSTLPAGAQAHGPRSPIAPTDARASIAELHQVTTSCLSTAPEPRCGYSSSVVSSGRLRNAIHPPQTDHRQRKYRKDRVGEVGAKTAVTIVKARERTHDMGRHPNRARSQSGTPGSARSPRSTTLRYRRAGRSTR